MRVAIPLFLLFSWLFTLPLQAQSLVCAPIQGHTTPHSLSFWLMVEGAKEVRLTLSGPNGTTLDLQTEGRRNWKGNIPLEAEFKGLEAGQEYLLTVLLDGLAWLEEFKFRTFPDAENGEYSFMAGSCAFYGTGAFRIIRPGSYTHIFDAMRATPSDFFLWLGDNVYLLTGEWNDVERTYEKYTRTRLDPRTNAFLRSRPQYAILDDHDFGPDNSGFDFPNKDMTSACFSDFWPNPYAGTPETKGNFCNFRVQDSEFFLLDDRYYRKAADSSQMYGPGQMAWLKQQLQASNANFKFIVTGSQSLSEVNQHETWSKFAERKELFDFLRSARIEGVVFLSGDRHFTEFQRLEQAGMYPLHELTCSPLTSILRKKPLNEKDVEHVNPLRLENTLTVEHNFARLSISGPADERVCLIEVFDASGVVLWTQRIAARTLRF